MSGVAIVRAMLVGDIDVVAVAPAARIVGGDLPLNTVLPAISITLVDGLPRLDVEMAADKPRMHVDRVQVTAFVKSAVATPAGSGYPGLQTLMRAILRASRKSMRGREVAGVTVDSVLPDMEGPDFSDPVTAIQSRTRDFLVKYSL